MIAFRFENKLLNSKADKYFKIFRENYNYNYTSYVYTQNPIYGMERCSLEHFIGMTQNDFY